MRRSFPWPASCAAALAGLLLLSGCAERGSSRPAWPAGALLVARTGALSHLLERLATLEETPLGREARRLEEALPACEVVEARAESGSLAEALGALDCAPPESPLAALHRERGERDLAFAVPLAGGGHVVGTLALGANGDADLALALPPGALRGAARLLVPGADAPGPGVLARRDALARARVRPDAGLDLASLVPDDGQGAQLFRLKSELFAGVVLDGTWEAAVYVPAAGRAMPDAALAVGFTRRAPAVAAMEGFVSELLETWPLRRTFFAVDDAEGACLLDLGVLPELAPCYVATGRALVVGWNPASLRRALARELDDTAPPAGAGSTLVLELARFAEADARLASAASAPSPLSSTRWPWQRLWAQGAREGGSVRVRVHLDAATAPPVPGA